ncbi:zinc metallopeptidase [Thermus sp.]|uniref:zinc metallopeptidase n=1 Tax=Thermus sp. TaxID=275 RepID=UPI003D0D1C5C
MNGVLTALTGMALVVSYAVYLAFTFRRYRGVPVPLEAGPFAEEVLRRLFTGFRVRVGRRNGVRYPERSVYLTRAVYAGRSVYHLAVAVHEVGHALQWRERPHMVRAVQGALTLALGLLLLGFLAAPSPVGAAFLTGGYGLFLMSLPLEVDANRRGLQAVPPEWREEVGKVMAALTASYLVVPLGGILVAVGFLVRAS